jgi:hypothetical protein
MAVAASNGEVGDLGTVSKFGKVGLGDPEATREDARRTIAITLVCAYLAVIVLNAAIPVGMLLWIGKAASPAELSGVKDILAIVTAGTTSVTGVIGFVLGYYFKSEEKERKRK